MRGGNEATKPEELRSSQRFHANGAQRSRWLSSAPPCSDVVIYSGLSELRSAKRATQRVYLRRNKRIASDSEGAAPCANVNLIIDEAAIQRAVELRQTIIWMGERITPLEGLSKPCGNANQSHAATWSRSWRSAARMIRAAAFSETEFSNPAPSEAVNSQ